MDRLTSMTVFARVAAARSFSAAARELGISQATASKHVQTLESWLGTRLLQRTTRRVALTDVGASFFVQCTRILEDMETARQTGRPAENLRGTLRVIAPVGFGSTCLARLMVEFMANHPEMLLSVTLCDRPIDIIEEGFDLELRFDSAIGDDARLMVYRFRPLQFVVCAAPGYMAAYGEPTTPAELAEHHCLTDSRHPGDVWRFTGPDGEVEVQVTGRLKSDNGMLRREAARAGAGIVLAPEFLVHDDLVAGKLVRLLPDYALPEWQLGAVCAAHRAISPKVRSFIAFLSARLSDQEADSPAFALA